MKGKIDCYVCHKLFIPRNNRGKYCSIECYKKYNTMRTGRISNKNIPASTVGAVSEMAVCLDLLERGYSVFRSMSPSCPCDLIAMKDGKIERIEVKTGYRAIDGKLTYPATKNNKFDKLAIYIRTNKEVIYTDKPYH